MITVLIEIILLATLGAATGLLLRVNACTAPRCAEHNTANTRTTA